MQDIEQRMKNFTEMRINRNERELGKEKILSMLRKITLKTHNT